MGGAVPSHLVQILISVLVVKDQAELLGGGAILFSVFCGTAGLFGNGAQGFGFSTSSPTLAVFFLFVFLRWPSYTCEVMSPPLAPRLY